MADTGLGEKTGLDRRVDCAKEGCAVEARPSFRALSTGKTLLAFAACAAVLVVLDRLTKLWAEGATAGGIDFIPGFMNFVLVYNKGASYGMLEGATLLLLGISVAICALIVAYVLRYRKHRVYELLGLAGVFAGAVGNAWDRAAAGQVTDFLHFEFFEFPVFNVADCCITIGVVLVLVFLLLDKCSPFAERESAGERAGAAGAGDSAEGGE